MPRTVEDYKKKEKNISEYQHDYFTKTGESLLKLAGKLEADDAAEARKYAEVLKDFFDKKDDEYIKQNLEILDGLKGFLSKKGKDGKTYYDALVPEVMALPSSSEKVKNDAKEAERELDKNFLFISDAVGIEGHPDDVKTEIPTVMIGGKIYTRAEFKAKMYGNGWDPEKDSILLDAIFEGWGAGIFHHSNLEDQEFIDSHAQSIEKAGSIMQRLVDVPITPDKKAAYKHSIVSEVKTDCGIDGYSDQWSTISEALEKIKDEVLRENNEDEKAGFLKDVRELGYTSESDIELLSQLFDCRFNGDGKLNESIGDELSRFRKNEGTYEDKGKAERLKLLIAGLDEKIGHQVRSLDGGVEGLSDEQRKFLDRYRTRIENIELRIQGAERAKEALAHGWAGPEDVYEDLFTLEAVTGEDQLFYTHMKDILAGRSALGDKAQLKPDGQLIYLQSYEALKKAGELLKDIQLPDRIYDVLIDKALKGVEKALEILEPEAARERETTLPMIEYLRSLSEENKNDIKALHDEMGKIKEKDLPPRGKAIWNALEMMAEKPENISGVFEGIFEGMKTELETNLAAFVGALGKNHVLYEKAIKVLGIFDPDHVEEAKNRAAEVTRQKEEALAADIANAQREMEERYNAFVDERGKFLDLRTNMQELDHAYFGHGNSTEYTNMMRALDDCVNAKNDSELSAAKEILAGRSKDYLDHTGLGKASKLHGKSETRRLCAFYMLSLTDEHLYDQYAFEANDYRANEDQISLNRLRNLEGVGKPSAAVAAAMNNGLVVADNLPKVHNNVPAAGNNQQNRVGINDLIREENSVNNAAGPRHANTINNAARPRDRRTLNQNNNVNAQNNAQNNARNNNLQGNNVPRGGRKTK